MNPKSNPFAVGTYDWYVAEAKMTPAEAASAILRNGTWRLPSAAKVSLPLQGRDPS
ncbi:hypothetical protein KDW54_29235 [Burkholderia ambifaria]|uniref:hypothetical protein n=1 Tax=Burkholderia ambifaria TaxID=152480 RepID=UPI0015E36F02|nr:hypothetical protein [Burkholderia ambifaria]MBR8186482.1 hypothetical protein [Burkholderia ambifaria]